MMSKKYPVVFLVIFLCASLVLSGCSQKETPNASMLTIAIESSPMAMDPQLVRDVTSMTFINAVYEGLCRKDKNGLPMPGMAKEWDISSDGTTYTFYLRDAQWANGTPVTAWDFKEAWLRALHPDPETHIPSEMGYLLYCIKGATEYNWGEVEAGEVGIQVKDEKTLEVTLVKPTPYFLDLVCNSVFMPINKAFYDKQPMDRELTTFGSSALTTLGNGPFRIKEWNFDENVVLEKNEEYWNKDQIKLDDVNLRVIEDAAAALSEFKAGGVDATDITSEQRIEAEKQDLPVSTYDRGTTVFIDFNKEDPFLGNAKVRKALAYALDRETLTKEILKDGSEKALGFVNPVIQGYKAPFREEVGDLFKDHQVGEAKSLLVEGMEELGLAEAPQVEFIVDDRASSKKVAQYYQNLWRENLGLNIQLVTMSYDDAFYGKLEEGDYQMVLLLWGADFNDPASFLEIFESGAVYNSGGYNNQDFDALLDQCKTELDPEARMRKLAEAERILMEDMAVCPLYFEKVSYLADSRVKGLIRGKSAIQNMDLYWTTFE